MVTARCISADSHVVEPPELFAPLKRRFGERAPHVRITPERGPQLDLGDGRLGLPIGGFLQANFDFSRPDAREMLKKGYELARPGVYDIKARLADQDRDGLDAEVVYPSVLFNVYQIEDTEVVDATFQCYNDWVAEYRSDAPDRLFGLAAIQLRDLDAAIAEMERAKKLGFVGVCIPATAPPDKLYSDPWYDRFWDAAQALQMPLTMHIFTGATANHGLPWRQGTNALAFAGIVFSINDLIVGGVCERFPGLRFVITEFETGWLGITLKRLDWGYVRQGMTAPEGHLPEKPSFYWKRNFRITFEDDEIGIATRHISGTGTLMWGNDYPHGDSVFPHSQSVIDQVMKDCTPEERYEITAKNVVELYKLPLEVS
jgi:predicted TIM-barrel fold metal-dependent hydrolase